MSQHQINLQDNTLTSIFLYGKLFIEPTLIHQHFMSGEFINIETIDHDYFRDTYDKLFDSSCDSFSTLRNIHGNHWGFVGSLIIHDFVQLDGFNKMRINFHITVFDSANTRVEGVTQYLVKFKNFLITLMNILQLDYIINIIPYHYNVTHKQQNGNDCAVFALLYQKQFIKVLLDTERTRYSLLNIDNPITSIPDSKNDYISGMFESCFQSITQNLATQQRVDTILDFCGWSNIYGKIDTNVPTSISISSNISNTTTTVSTSSTSIATTTTAASTTEDDGFEKPTEEMLQEMEAEKPITPPLDVFYRDHGEPQGGCCGPHSAVKAIFFIKHRYRNQWPTNTNCKWTIKEFQEFTSNLIETEELIEKAKVGITTSNLDDDVQKSITLMFNSYHEKGNTNEDLYIERMKQALILTENEVEEGKDSMWYTDLILCLAIRAALQDDISTDCNPGSYFTPTFDVDRFTTLNDSTNNLENNYSTIMNIIGFSTLYVHDKELQNDSIQEYCKYFDVIIVNSKGKHFITYFRKFPVNPSNVDDWNTNRTNNNE
jgi:hypothetical protein